MSKIFLKVLSLIKKFIYKPSKLEYFSSYQEAMNFIKVSGYQDSELAKIIILKSQIFRDKLQKKNEISVNELKALSAVGFAISNNKINVLDFGGGGGIHYFIAKAFFKNAKISWAIIETETFCKEASSLEEDNLRYFSNMNDAVKFLGGVDLVFASSSIQYCNDPLETLRCLVALGSKYLVVTRTPVLNEPELKPVISIQSSKLSDNGPGEIPNGYHDKEIFYPITFLNKSDLMRIVSLNYDIIGTVIEGDWCGYHMDKIKPTMLGVFGIRKTSNRV